MNGVNKLKLFLNDTDKVIQVIRSTGSCPSRFGLEDGGCSGSCSQCWDEALSKDYPIENINRRIAE